MKGATICSGRVNIACLVCGIRCGLKSNFVYRDDPEVNSSMGKLTSMRNRHKQKPIIHGADHDKDNEHSLKLRQNEVTELRRIDHCTERTI